MLHQAVCAFRIISCDGDQQIETFVGSKSQTMSTLCFSTYIQTNKHKTVLYTGVTNDLATRLIEHWIGKEGCFTTRYRVHFLIWSESTRYVLNAIAREKEIKKTSRYTKELLINQSNPEWEFWNKAIVGNWPPTIEQMEVVKARWRKEDAENIHDPLSFRMQVKSWG